MFYPNPPNSPLSILLPLITPIPSVLALNAFPHLQPREATSLLTCYQDNQLRALERFSTQASTFCPTYLATTTGAALPTYVSDFQNGDISSACSCFQASATETAIVLTFPAPTSKASAPTTTASTPFTSPSPSSSSPSTQNAGLSTGAKAGIGIACAVIALLAIGIGAALFHRRKKRTPAREGAKRRASVSQLDDDVGAGAERPPAYDAVEKDAGGYNHEVEGGNRFELRGDKTGGG